MAKKGQLTTADALSFEQVQQLVNGLHNDQLYVFEMYVICSVSFGLRASDVLTIKWCDILNKGSFTKNEQKTGKARNIQISPKNKEKFLSLYKLIGSPDPSQYVFDNGLGNNKPYSIMTINNKLKTFRVKYRLKINNFSTHTFRKAFGKYVYDSAKDKSDALIKLMTIFKHSSPQITLNYIGITQESINDVYNSIGF